LSTDARERIFLRLLRLRLRRFLAVFKRTVPAELVVRVPGSSAAKALLAKSQARPVDAAKRVCRSLFRAALRASVVDFKWHVFGKLLWERGYCIGDILLETAPDSASGIRLSWSFLQELLRPRVTSATALFAHRAGRVRSKFTFLANPWHRIDSVAVRLLYATCTALRISLSSYWLRSFSERTHCLREYHDMTDREAVFGEEGKAES